MQKTKILFFLPNLNGGGAERVTVNILRQIDVKKFDISLLLVNKTGKFLELIPSHIDILECTSSKVSLSILNVRKVILDIKPDIVYSTLFNANIVVDLSLIGIKKRPKVILRSPNSPKLVLENKQISFIKKMLLERAYKNAYKIIAQTPEMKNEIIKYHHIHESKIAVFLNPIDTKLIKEKTKNIQNPFDTEFTNVVAAGRLTEQKGFDILIESFKNVISKNKKFRLFIIGEGHLKKQFENIIFKNNLENYIFLLGFQDNPYKYFYYSDLYVLSSIWEGLPNTVLENLYLQKPIVATRCIPFMDNLIDNYKNGILVEPKDVISLSDAILNYTLIDTSHSTLDFNLNELNSIFT